ncbi:unnamed protein product [Boreogadus saida]
MTNRCTPPAPHYGGTRGALSFDMTYRRTPEPHNQVGGGGMITESVDLYSSSLSPLLDRHAPVQPRTVPFPRSAPRYTSELRLLKRTGRVLERRLRTQDRLFTN